MALHGTLAFFQAVLARNKARVLIEQDYVLSMIIKIPKRRLVPYANARNQCVENESLNGYKAIPNRLGLRFF